MAENQEQNKEKTIEIKSEEIQEILIKTPHKIIRYGIYILSGIILLLVIGSCIFSYPDTITGEITVTSTNPPVWSIAQTSERIKKIYVHNGDSVKNGDILAVMENTAKIEDIITVENLLQEVTFNPEINIPEAVLCDSFCLGNVQPAYSDFVQKTVLYKNFISLNLIEQESATLQKQKAGKIEYINHLKEQLEIKSKHLELAISEYNREKYLFEKELISEYDMEKAESALLEEKETQQQLRTSISLEKVELSKLQESGNKLSFQYAQERNQLQQQLMSAYRELNNSINEWRRDFVFEALDDGVVTFHSIWNENQFVKAGDAVFAVVPSESSSFTGKLKVPLAGAGKIRAGQVVLIQSDAFPYLEYGYMQGTVNSISLIPEDNSYTVEVSFPEQLFFTSGKPVFFTGEIVGTAKIITEKRALITRILFPIFYMFEAYL